MIESSLIHSKQLALASDLILKRAVAIEAEVEKNCGGTSQEYKAKIRSLFVNLKDKNNPGLRESVVSGDISAVRFSSMTSQVRIPCRICIFYLTIS